MKKIIIPIILFVLVVIISVLVFKPNNKFHLDDKYYSNGNFIEVNSEALNSIDSNNYLIFTYNNYCNFEIPCDKIFQDFMTKNKIDIISIPFEEFRKTKFYNNVKYAPSILIVKNGRVISYLDAEKNEDMDMYQDVNKFEHWLEKYIYLSK